MKSYVHELRAGSKYFRMVQMKLLTHLDGVGLAERLAHRDLLTHVHDLRFLLRPAYLRLFTPEHTQDKILVYIVEGLALIEPLKYVLVFRYLFLIAWAIG